MNGRLVTAAAAAAAATAPFSSELQPAALTVMDFKCGEQDGSNMAGGLPE